MRYRVRWTEHYELEVEAESEKEAELRAIDSAKGFRYSETIEVREIPTRIYLKEGDETT